MSVQNHAVSFHGTLSQRRSLLYRFTGSASAHHLWLEADGQGAKLYFGEFEENLREASPGLLDRFKPLPEAKAVGAAGASRSRSRRRRAPSC